MEKFFFIRKQITTSYPSSSDFSPFPLFFAGFFAVAVGFAGAPFLGLPPLLLAAKKKMFHDHRKRNEHEK